MVEVLLAFLIYIIRLTVLNIIPCFNIIKVISSTRYYVIILKFYILISLFNLIFSIELGLINIKDIELT